MEFSPKRILWPTDFSPLSAAAARYAATLRTQFRAQLHVIHVVAPPLSPDVTVMLPAEAPIAFTPPELEQAALVTLRQVVVEEFGADDTIVTEVTVGSPWQGICDYARKAAIDLIVVATHGRTGLRHVLIGSTAERIVQHAPCPVLVIKHGERDAPADVAAKPQARGDGPARS